MLFFCFIEDISESTHETQQDSSIASNSGSKKRTSSAIASNHDHGAPARKSQRKVGNLHPALQSLVDHKTSRPRISENDIQTGRAHSGLKDEEAAHIMRFIGDFT